MIQPQFNREIITSAKGFLRWAMKSHSLWWKLRCYLLSIVKLYGSIGRYCLFFMSLSRRVHKNKGKLQVRCKYEQTLLDIFVNSWRLLIFLESSYFFLLSVVLWKMRDQSSNISPSSLLLWPVYSHDGFHHIIHFPLIGQSCIWGLAPTS